MEERWMRMMNDDEARKFRELLKTMPREHPFEEAVLCELYCYDDRPTYVTRLAYDAFTYPTYDKDNKCFLYRHHDMEAETSDDVCVDLMELLEESIDDDFVRAIEICNEFNVPMKDIKACQEEILKMNNSCEAKEI